MNFPNRLRYRNSFNTVVLGHHPLILIGNMVLFGAEMPVNHFVGALILYWLRD